MHNTGTRPGIQTVNVLAFQNQSLPGPAPGTLTCSGWDHLAAEVASMGVGQAGQAAQLCHHVHHHHSHHRFWII